MAETGYSWSPLGVSVFLWETGEWGQSWLKECEQAETSPQLCSFLSTDTQWVTVVHLRSLAVLLRHIDVLHAALLNVSVGSL